MSLKPEAFSPRPADPSGATSADIVNESLVDGGIPRFELAAWRDHHGVLAGITGRGAPGERFDLGLATGEPVGQVMGRWRQLRRAEPGFHATVFSHQVHGSEVMWHRDVYGWLILEGYDGHATSRPGVLLTVSVADCVPVYLLDPGSRLIALLHAGWRGTADGILSRGVEALVAHGARTDRLMLHCGVGICGRCYEVGQEVMIACGRPPTGDGPWHIDLREVLRSQALHLGLDRITTSGHCSAHDSERFFSHRRSRGSDGRMVAYLGLLP